MAAQPSLDAFENVKRQVGACGIWCGSCVIGNGALRQVSQRYEQLVTDYGLHEWGPKDFDYDEFLGGLRSLQQVPVCPGCQRGGGRNDCELRACAESRQLARCVECAPGTDCPQAELLAHMRSGAQRAGLIVDLQPCLGEGQLEAWIEQIRRRWPSSVLFEGEG
jgi:hypothetical protein